MSKSFRFLAPAAATLALAAPVAQARPAIDPPAPTGGYSAPALTIPAPSADDGFDWGSAAIGAGGIAGLLGLLSAGIALSGRARVPSAR